MAAPSPFLARSAIAITAYLPLVFNSKTRPLLTVFNARANRPYCAVRRFYLHSAPEAVLRSATVGNAEPAGI